MADAICLDDGSYLGWTNSLGLFPLHKAIQYKLWESIILRILEAHQTAVKLPDVNEHISPGTSVILEWYLQAWRDGSVFFWHALHLWLLVRNYEFSKQYTVWNALLFHFRKKPVQNLQRSFVRKIIQINNNKRNLNIRIIIKHININKRFNLKYNSHKEVHHLAHKLVVPHQEVYIALNLEMWC